MTRVEHAEDMFCHAIYVSWHVINRAYKTHLGRLGLTYPQYITLTLLWEKDQQNVGALASWLEMETSTLTPLLKRLEGLGHVSRQRQKSDERQVVVSLTQSGRALQKEAASITACMIAETGLSAQELESLVQTLRTLRTGFKRDTSA